MIKRLILLMLSILLIASLSSCTSNNRLIEDESKTNTYEFVSESESASTMN